MGNGRDSYGHRWNGWPGAMCYYCHSEDPREICLADCSVSDETGTCDISEHQPVQCPASDARKDLIDKKMNPE